MESTKKLRIAATVQDSIVDGPGLRYVVFTQGCPHRCEGCHNPDTFDYDGGYEVDVDELVGDIDKNPILDGVTFSGGEPVIQADALLPLAKAVKDRGLHLMLYSGYTFEQILKIKAGAKLLGYVDILVDGPFELDKKSLDLTFRGSFNQRVIDVPKSLKKRQAVLYDFDK
ncbi:MAG: anaerobic ribonucleoside-triphosphate reductase activating protein [Eubacteriales bacterium]|jgi:anaerobic ribonucleoside-triphosphate reductase activating protein|nr:anaerobic ribonucleoside-triphosphate reductase activating protein [Eubacteriales bacterium]